MSKKQLKIVLWILFTVLFFVVFCGVSYLISGSLNWSSAIFFYIVLNVLDKFLPYKGIRSLVDAYSAKWSKEPKTPSTPEAR